MTQRASDERQGLSQLVLLISFPGAVVLGSAGFGLGMVGIYVNAPPPTQLTVICTFIWGVFGGGCLGATPGLVAGWYWNLKWVRPFLCAAAVFLLTVPIVNSVQGDAAFTMRLCTALVLLGFGIGALFVGSRDKTESFKERPPIGCWFGVGTS